MFDRNREFPWHHLATAVLLIGFCASVAILIKNALETVPHSEWIAALIALSVAVAAVSAGYLGQLNDYWAIGKDDPDVKRIRVDQPQKEGLFLFRAFVLLNAYVCFFFVSARTAQANFKDADFPDAYILVGIVAAATMAAFSRFVVLYARHNRRSSLLKAGLDGCFEVPIDNVARRRLVDDLYSKVSKDDHIFEPPGNVFVTIGIMATFLGLAIGLVTLDLSAMLKPAGNNPAGLAALQSFMACIGLALGSSMVGVLMALFAQMLRGHGPNECSEDLLRRAEVFLREGR